MVKTRSRPVISKIFVMLRSLHTSESSPSFVRRRFTPPTSTPRVVESMNVVSVKSTITCLPPLPITSRSCALNSGAVYRSTSPTSEITYRSPSSCCVLMSKFTLVPPELRCVRAPYLRAARSLTLRTRGERLDLLLGVGRVRVVRSELDELLVGGDRTRVVACVLGSLGEEQLVGGLRRVAERGDLPVCAFELLGGLLAGRERVVEALVRRRGDRLADRVLPRAQRAAERGRRRR